MVSSPYKSKNHPNDLCQFAVGTHAKRTFKKPKSERAAAQLAVSCDSNATVHHLFCSKMSVIKQKAGRFLQNWPFLIACKSYCEHHVLFWFLFCLVYVWPWNVLITCPGSNLAFYLKRTGKGSNKLLLPWIERVV